MRRVPPKKWLSLLSLALVAAGCPGPKPETSDAGVTQPEEQAAVPHTAPSEEVLKGIARIHEELPGASVQFSLHTGAIARVDSAAISRVDEPGRGPGAPLVESHGVGEVNEHASLMEFMLRFGSLYGVDDAFIELQAPRDAANDPLSLPQEGFSNGDLPQVAGMRVRRLLQTIQGVPVTGREVVGVFDRHGGLQSVGSRLLRVDQNFFGHSCLHRGAGLGQRDAAGRRHPAQPAPGLALDPIRRGAGRRARGGAGRGDDLREWPTRLLRPRRPAATCVPASDSQTGTAGAVDCGCEERRVDRGDRHDAL